MKALILAAALAPTVIGMSAARADELFVIVHGKTAKDFVCQLNAYSFADTFKMMSENAGANRLPAPQIDYTSGAANGVTILNYVDPNLGKPQMMLFYTNRVQCDAGAARLTDHLHDRAE